MFPYISSKMQCFLLLYRYYLKFIIMISSTICHLSVAKNVSYKSELLIIMLYYYLLLCMATLVWTTIKTLNKSKTCIVACNLNVS